DSEIEDIIQQTYVNAFAHLRQFEARSQFTTWLTRILINEASGRRRKLRRTATASSVSDDPASDPVAEMPTADPDPDRQAYTSELVRVLEQAIDDLPETYRVVLVLRDIEGMSTSETAKALDLGEEAIKTRLHRARAMIRRGMTDRLGAAAAAAFPFHAPRCDRVVAAVLARIAST